MSESSPRMQWPYPTREDDPWYDFFKDYVLAADASGYAHREDRSIIWTGGGTISWTLSSETLEWTGAINIYSPIGAHLLQIAADSIAGLADGEVVYVVLTRQPLANITATLLKASQLPSNDNAMSFAVRIGDVIYFRTGMSLGDGDSAEGVAPVPSAGGGGGSVALGVGYTYTQAATPVEEVAGDGSFNGGTVGGGTAYFKAAITNAWFSTGIGETTRVRLYDMGPAAGPPDSTPRLVSELTFTAQSGPRGGEQALSVVSASPTTNQILDVDRMYEVVIIQDVSTTGDVAFLGSAGLEVR